MLRLATGDRARLVAILEVLDELETEQGRHDALASAGLDTLVPKVDLAGAAEPAVGRIIDGACRFDLEGKEALHVFCAWAKGVVGVEQQKLIDEVLARCKPGEPEPPPDASQPHGRSTPTEPRESREGGGPAWLTRRVLIGAIAAAVLVTGLVVVIAARGCGGPTPPAARDAMADSRLDPDASLDAAFDAPPDAPVDAAPPDVRPDGPRGSTPRPRGPCWMDSTGTAYGASQCRNGLVNCRPLSPSERDNPDYTSCNQICECGP